MTTSAVRRRAPQEEPPTAHGPRRGAAARRAQEAEAWRLLRAAVLDHDRRRDACRATGLAFSRVVALLALEHGPRSMSGVAGALATDAPYATVVVRDLERRGLVRRETDPHDRRGRQVVLTEPGRTAAEEARAILEVPPAWLAALDPASLGALVETLRTVPPRR